MLVDEKKNSRIGSFDVSRILFVLMVCYIHSVNTYSSIALTFMRVAVPGFFVITGYFLVDSLRKNKLKGQLFKTLQLFFTGWFLYLIWEGAKAVHRGTVLEYGITQFHPKALFELFFLCHPQVGGHLWFLLAQFWGLLLIGILYEKHCMQILYPWMILGWLALLIFGKYSVLFFHTDITMFYTQNAICVAVPFMAMGMCLRKNRKILMQAVSVQKNIIYLCLSYFFALAERACLLHFQIMGSRDFYIGTIFFVWWLFVLAIRFPNISRLQSIAMIGRNYTAGMYIIHIWVLDIVEKVTNNIFVVYPLNTLICHTKFLIVFLLSLGTVILWKKIQTKTCKIL